MPTAQRHWNKLLAPLLTAALLVGACGGDSPVTGGPDTIVLDIDSGIDLGFDLPPGDDTAPDVESDGGAIDVADDIDDDSGGDDVEDDSGGDDAGDDSGGDDVGDDSGGDDSGGDDVAPDAPLDLSDTGADVAPDAPLDLSDAGVLRDIGEPCDSNDQCLSDRCESFGDVRICTDTCATDCGVDGIVCFDNLCTPEDYCGVSDAGRPVGPGCPCEGACDVNATCEVVDPSTEICDCNAGYEGDGLTCTLRALPWIRVRPESIDFGTVGLFTSAFETLTIENVGPEPRLLSDVYLRLTPSQGFAIFAPFAFPIDIAPETAVTVDVRFRPTFAIGGGGTEYVNDVVVETDDPAEPLQEVPISGLAVSTSEICLTFDETTIDFGVVDGGETESETVTLSNCGSGPLTVDIVELLVETDALSIDFGPTLPTEIASGAGFDVTITYAPVTPAPVRAVVSARSTNGAEAALRVLGGYECPVAAFDAEGGRLRFGGQDRFVGRVGDTWAFDGADSDDPEDGDLAFFWTITSPDGSHDLGVDPDLSSRRFSMMPDAAGRYVIELRVESDESGLLSCNLARFTADAFPLHAEVVIQLSWDNSADMDLHLMQSNEEGVFGPWGRGGEPQPDDAYWANLFADFGVLDEPADNGWHLGDELFGPATETVDLGALDPGRRYRVGVNYARRRGTSSVTPTVTVTVDGGATGTYSTTMNETGFWMPVFIEGDGTLTTPDGG